MTNRIYLAILSAAMVVVPAAPCMAQAQRSRGDEALTKDVGGKELDDLDRELFGEKSSGKSNAGKNDGGDLKTRLQRELGDAAESENQNPLLRIARRMQSAGEMLQANRGGEAGRQQREIVADLDRLIGQARKSCKSSAAQSQAQPSARTPMPGTSPPNAPPSPPSRSGNNPAGQQQADRTNSTPAKQTDPEQMQQLLKRVWGDLPPHVREQVLQLPADEFLPQYETLIEDYYRRLAEERK